MRKCAMPARTTMNRKIQRKHNDDVFSMSHGEECYYYSGPVPGLRAGRGARHTKEITVNYE
eukprot:354858-Amphidinium_carterae.1